MGRILTVNCDGCSKDISVNMNTGQIKPDGESEPHEVRCGPLILGELCGACQQTLKDLLKTHTLGQ